MAMTSNPTWQKTLSWLIVSYFMIAICVWLSTGNLIAGLVGSLAATPVKVPVFAIHEWIWGKFIFGGRNRG